MSTERIPVSVLKDYIGDLGFCFPADDARFFLRLNEAEERMQVYGRWWGSIQEVQFCVRRDECNLVWPREVDVIEAISLPRDTGPLNINNPWYSYGQTHATLGACLNGTCWGLPVLGWGAGPCGPLSMDMQARSPCSFSTTRNGEKIKFYPTNAVDVGKTIVVQGYDSNKIWVRTNPGSGVIDGELVTLALPSVTTTTAWTAAQPVAIRKQPTSYRVLMYSLNTSTLAERPLGIYQASETAPVYRSTRLPMLRNRCASGSSCSNDFVTVRALCKLAHIKLASDDDWLLYRNIPAYIEAITAVLRWKEGNPSLGNFHFFGQVSPKQARASNQATLSKGGAIPMLRAELRSMTADNTDVETHYEYDDRLAWETAGYR